MTIESSTPHDSRNFDPVAEAMARASLSTHAATESARAKLEENTRRVGVLQTWREHPDVIAFVEEQRASNDYGSWSDLRAEFDPTWGVHDERTCLARACRSLVGMSDMPEADRAIIAERHPFETRPLVDPTARKWALLRDNTTVCPVAMADDVASLVWATTYRSSLHEHLRECGMLVGMSPGKPPVLAVWVGVAQTPSVLRSWLRGIGGERFDLVRESSRKHDFERRLEPYTVDDWLTVEPVKSQGATRKAAFTIHTTGIAPLDALLATKGIPRGARVFVQAATGHGKSVFDLQVAEHFAAAGFRVVWVATSDESPESIIARRLQRIGYARDQALRLALGDDAGSVAARARLNPNLDVIDGQAVYLEDVIATAPDVLVLDPVQKIRTRAGDDGEAAVRVAEQSGITLVAAASKVRSAGKRSKIEAAFGGAYIENGATLLLDLDRDGSTVTTTVLKSRYGGEGQSFTVDLDAERQTLTACHGTLGTAVPSLSEADANRHEQILAALAKGPKTAGALRTWVVGHNKQIATALDALVAAGKVALNGKEYALRVPA